MCVPVCGERIIYIIFLLHCGNRDSNIFLYANKCSDTVNNKCSDTVNTEHFNCVIKTIVYIDWVLSFSRDRV
jgi:hypothetical protein